MTDDTVVELWPWQAKTGVERQIVWVLVDGKPKAIPIRIKSSVKNGTRLKLPGDVYLRVRITVRPLVFRVLAGALVFAGLLAAVFQSTLLLAVAWALVEFCRSRRRRTTGFRRQLCVFGVLYLVPMGIALAFHVALGVVLAARSDALSTDRLRSLEQSLAKASEYFSENLKLGELEVLGVLVLVYLLTAIIANALASKVLHGAADFYGKFSGPVAAGLATLTAFTFFGTHLGTQAETLDQHLKTTQLKYDEVSRRVEQDLASRVASGLAEKIRDALPPDYQELLAAEYPTTLTLPGVLSPITVEKPVDNQPRRPMPTTTSREHVVTAQKVVDQAVRPPTPGGEKKIVLQVEKLVTEYLMKFAQDAIKQVPLLDPLLQAFVEAVDKHLQDGVLDAAYNRAMDAVWRNPGDPGAVAREAVDLVSQVDVSGPAANATTNAQQAVRRSSVQRLIKDLGDETRWRNARDKLVGIDLTVGELGELEKAMTPPAATAPTEVHKRAARIIDTKTQSDEQRTRAKRICGCY